MRREIVALLLLCGVPFWNLCCLAQNRTGSERQESVSRLVEYIVYRNEDHNESAGNLQDFSDMLTNLLEKDIPADSSGFVLLRDWGVLTSVEFDLLLSHYKRFGNGSSAGEYLLIPGIDRNKIKMVLSLLSFEEEVGSDPLPRVGFIARSIYRSGGLSAYSRCNLSLPAGVSAVVVAESDAGEQLPDYFSWSIQAERKGLLRSVTAGSYRVVAGQGLILSNAFPVTFSITPSSFSQVVRRPEKYTSADENRAFRGVAASFECKSVSLKLMGSLRKLDARVKGDGYSSLLETGLHISESERESKDLLQERMGALDLSIGGKSWSAGVVVCGAFYSLPYRGRKSSVLEMEKRWGQRRMNGSLNFRWSIGSVMLYGEAASDISFSVNTLAGALIRGSKGNEYSARFYYKDHSFVAPLTGLKNSYGSGRLSGDFVGKVRLRGDTFLWFKSLLGEDYYNLSLKIRPEYGHNPLEAALGLSARGLSGRLDYRVNLCESLSMHIRGDASLSSKRAGVPSKGFAAHAELSYAPVESKTSISARFTWFDVPRWDNRVYSYERDILYLFTSRVLYGEGLRWYVNCRGSLSGSCDIWFKYSGEMKQGVIAHEMKLQLSLRMPLRRF
jgi:hypothetical protein